MKNLETISLTEIYNAQFYHNYKKSVINRGYKTS